MWSQENGDKGYDIYLYDISTQLTGIITTTNSSIPESDLDIYGNVVVWTKSGNVYMYDIISNETAWVTDDGNAYQPAIYGDWIVYTAGDPYSGCSKDIYMYEISAGRTTQITTSTLAFAPSVYGDKIVYADCRSNPETEEVRDIYLYGLSNTSNDTVANFVSSVTSGTEPLNVSFTDTSAGTPDAWYWTLEMGLFQMSRTRFIFIYLFISR